MGWAVELRKNFEEQSGSLSSNLADHIDDILLTLAQRGVTCHADLADRLDRRDGTKGRRQNDEDA